MTMKVAGGVIAFTVPGQPQGKGRPKATSRGGFVRMYTPAKTASYEGMIAVLGQEAMAGRPPLACAISLELDIRHQVPASWSRKKRDQALRGSLWPTTKPDVDNVLKAIGDGLNGVAWIDDVQVVQVSLTKRYSETPGVLVVVREVAQAELALEPRASLPGLFAPAREPEPTVIQPFAECGS